MSRLRRPFLYDRYIFVMVDLLKSRVKLEDADYERLAVSLVRMRAKLGFVLTAWFFLPDPAMAGHAIIYPPYPLTISRAFSAVKVSSTAAVNRRRREAGVSCGKVASLLPPCGIRSSFRPRTASTEYLCGGAASRSPDRERLCGKRGVYPPESGATPAGEAARGMERVQLS